MRLIFILRGLRQMKYYRTWIQEVSLESSREALWATGIQTDVYPKHLHLAFCKVVFCYWIAEKMPMIHSTSQRKKHDSKKYTALWSTGIVHSLLWLWLAWQLKLHLLLPQIHSNGGKSSILDLARLNNQVADGIKASSRHWCSDARAALHGHRSRDAKRRSADQSTPDSIKPEPVVRNRCQDTPSVETFWGHEDADSCTEHQRMARLSGVF